VKTPVVIRWLFSRRGRMIQAWSALAILPLIGAASVPDYRAERAAMVADIQASEGRAGVPKFSEPVLNALRTVPRHQFVPPPMQPHAYANRPLPIGHGQTISQPLIVAMMTEHLQLSPQDIVLEIGAGSGYQAAILSQLVRHVYTIEIVAPLAKTAADTLKRTGHDNVTVRQGDGYLGWPEHAPFDAIMVTAGAETIPEPLVEQLKPGGRMIIPVGKTATGQELVLVEKDADGKIRKRDFGPVLFVPLTGIGQGK